MAITNRRLKVTFDFQHENDIVVLEENLNLKVKIEKNVLAMQNRADIEVINLGADLRARLLSNFTAWDKRLNDKGVKPLRWVGVKIEAGYGKETNLIYVGEVVVCELTASPPNTTIRFSCFTKQSDKTKDLTGRSPSNVTFKEYVLWAANQMGLNPGDVNFESSYESRRISNPARSIYTVAGLIWDIQDQYKPDVAAWIDDNILVVRDKNKVINPSEIVSLSEFVGIPTWNEWGASFKVLMNPAIKLAKGVTINSELNKSLNGTYVITKVSYELTSRDTNFYVSAQCSPAAS